MPEAEAANGGNKRKAEEMCDLADDLQLLAELLAAGRAGADDTASKWTVAEGLARHGAKRRKTAEPRGPLHPSVVQGLSAMASTEADSG